MKEHFQSNFVKMFLGLLVVLIWSTCYVTIKSISISDYPLTFAASRALVAGIILLTLAAMKGCIKAPRETWPWLCLSALTGTSLALWSMFGSVPTEGSVLASILGSSQAILVAPLAVIFLNDKQSILRWVLLGAGFFGLVLVIIGKSRGSGSVEGSLFALLASLGLAISSLVAKKLSGKMLALTLTTWQFLLGSIPLIAAAIIFEEPIQFRPTSHALWSLAYLAVLSSAGGSVVWNWLLKRSDVTTLTSLTMFGPPLSLILGVAIYNEHLSGIQWTGISIVLTSVICLQLSKDHYSCR